MVESNTIHIPIAWKNLIAEEFDKVYFKGLTLKVREEYLKKIVYPPPRQIFRAFELCPPENIRVVILGQDPYHTPGVADGLAFSTSTHNQVPPSLQNIFKELILEYGESANTDPDLSRWVKQGVFLLNTSLSVRKGEPNSHADYGWHEFTDAVISAISRNDNHVVFMLWGAYAQKKTALIDERKHLILTAPHPSPLSAHRGFLGCNHFKCANEYLSQNNRRAVDWSS
ncbi:MAG: uracil-DNA glycosylase [Candidatus Paceibacterota bacterium]